MNEFSDGADATARLASLIARRSGNWIHILRPLSIEPAAQVLAAVEPMVNEPARIRQFAAECLRALPDGAHLDALRRHGSLNPVDLVDRACERLHDKSAIDWLSSLQFPASDVLARMRTWELALQWLLTTEDEFLSNAGTAEASALIAQYDAQTADAGHLIRSLEALPVAASDKEVVGPANDYCDLLWQLDTVLEWDWFRRLWRGLNAVLSPIDWLQLIRAPQQHMSPIASYIGLSATDVVDLERLHSNLADPTDMLSSQG